MDKEKILWVVLVLAGMGFVMDFVKVVVAGGVFVVGVLVLMLLDNRKGGGVVMPNAWGRAGSRDEYLELAREYLRGKEQWNDFVEVHGFDVYEPKVHDEKREEFGVIGLVRVPHKNDPLERRLHVFDTETGNHKRFRAVFPDSFDEADPFFDKRGRTGYGRVEGSRVESEDTDKGERGYFEFSARGGGKRGRRKEKEESG